MEPTMAQQIVMLRDRIADYEAQVAELRAQTPQDSESSDRRKGMILSLEVQIQDDRMKLRRCTGEL